MKRISLLFLCFLPLALCAQGIWEVPQENVTTVDKTVKKEKEVKSSENEKYLVGAVPEVDGKVEWTMELDVPGKSASQIYDIVYACLSDLTKMENQLEGSAVSLVNKQECIIVANIKEWLVFKESFLTLDRTKFYYTLMAYCGDNHLKLVMTRIYYRYDEERVKGGNLYKAEEWINDNNALNRKKTKLLPGSAKFRRKTIDRKDCVFNIVKEAVLN